MKKTYAAALFCSLAMLATGTFTTATAQTAAPAEDPLMKIYRATPPRINDLINTKLDVRFDYKKCYMYGKEWVTLKPHFYPTDTLRLDAKGMDIQQYFHRKKWKKYPAEICLPG